VNRSTCGARPWQDGYTEQAIIRNSDQDLRLYFAAPVMAPGDRDWPGRIWGYRSEAFGV